MIDFTFSLRHLAFASLLAASLPILAEEGSIGIAVSDVTPNDATVTLTPSSEEVTYYWNFDSKESFLAKGGAEKAIENRIAVWERNASYYDNTTWQEMMNYELQSGAQTQTISDYFGDTLMFDTEYVVYAFGMNAAGDVIAPVATAEFTTTTPPASDNVFEITMKSIEKGKFYYTATAHIEPSNGDRYMVRFYNKEFVDQFDITPGSVGEKRFIAEEMLSYPTSDEMANGPHDFSYTRCREGEDYYVVVMGINPDKTPSTSLTLAQFTAQETVDLKGIIELEVSDITPMNARIRNTPSDDSINYYFGITYPDIIEAKGGIDNIPEKLIIDWWKFLADIYGADWKEFIPLQTRTGVLDDTVANLVEEGELEDLYWNTDWVLYAVGFDLDGNVITEPAVLEFHTPDCGKSDMTFEFQYVGKELDPAYPNQTRKYYIIEVDVYPSNDEESYRTCIMQPKYYDQYEGEGEEGVFEFITRQFLPSSIEIQGPGRIRMPGVPATDALGNTLDWSIFAIGWNEGPTTEIDYYTFNLTGESGVENISEEEVKVTAENGSLTISGLYDHAAVYAMDGKVAGVLKPGRTLSLPAGIYIVKYTTLDGIEKASKVTVK